MPVLDADDPAAAAVAAVRRGQAPLLMKGLVATPALMRAVLDPAAGLRTGRLICQVVLLEIRPAGRSMRLADTGICIRPTLEQKADVLRHAAAVAHVLGAEVPHVAALAATEAGQTKGTQLISGVSYSRYEVRPLPTLPFCPPCTHAPCCPD
jgi:phosphate butyryltransferase